MFNIADYSPDNLDRISKALKIISDEVELQSNRSIKTIVIAQNQIEVVGIYKEQFLSILRELNKETKIFRILNDLPNSSKMGLDDNIIFQIYNLDNFHNLTKEVESKKGTEQQIKSKPINWDWSNRNKGIYQFGMINFQQTGKTRKEVFVAMMDLFELNQSDIPIGIVATKAKIKPERVRIEISAINERFLKKTGYYFKGSGKGYYTINRGLSSQNKLTS